MNFMDSILNPAEHVAMPGQGRPTTPPNAGGDQGRSPHLAKVRRTPDDDVRGGRSLKGAVTKLATSISL